MRTSASATMGKTRMIFRKDSLPLFFDYLKLWLDALPEIYGLKKYAHKVPNDDMALVGYKFRPDWLEGQFKTGMIRKALDALDVLVPIMIRNCTPTEVIARSSGQIPVCCPGQLGSCGMPAIRTRRPRLRHHTPGFPVVAPRPVAGPAEPCPCSRDCRPVRRRRGRPAASLSFHRAAGAKSAPARPPGCCPWFWFMGTGSTPR